MAFRKFLHENARRLLYYAALMFAAMLLSYLIFAIIPVLSRPQSNLNYATEIMQISIFLLFVFGCLSASIMFRELRNRRTRIAYVCFPTTKFEKYIVEWFVYVLLFPVIFLLLSELSVNYLLLFFTSLWNPQKVWRTYRLQNNSLSLRKVKIVYSCFS